MATREVTHVKRDENGTIMALGNPGKKWSPRSKEAAISDIDRGIHSYYVKQGANQVKIYVVHPGGRYLRTAPDRTHADNLAQLADLPVLL